MPSELCAAIHDRMPAILPREKWATWLGEREADVDELRWMIPRPYVAELMRTYPVAVRVGNVRNNDAGLLDECETAPVRDPTGMLPYLVARTRKIAA